MTLRLDDSREKSLQTQQGIDKVSERIHLVADAQQQIDEQVDTQNLQIEQLQETQQELLELIDTSHQKSETSSLVATQLARVSENITKLIQGVNVDESLVELKKA